MFKYNYNELEHMYKIFPYQKHVYVLNLYVHLFSTFITLIGFPIIQTMHDHLDEVWNVGCMQDFPCNNKEVFLTDL